MGGFTEDKKWNTDFLRLVMIYGFAPKLLELFDFWCKATKAAICNKEIDVYIKEIDSSCKEINFSSREIDI